MKRDILNMIVVSMVMLISVLGVSAADLDITLTPVQDGSGQVYIEWASQGYDIAFKNQTSQFKLDLYAQWINLYQLRVDVNGGSWTDIDTGVEYDSYAEYFLEEDETKIIEDATKIEYNFSGWVIE